MNDPELRERINKLLDREVDHKPMPEHDPSPVRNKPWTPRIVEEGEQEHCDPLDYLQRTIDNPQMSHRDKVFAASNLAPYLHPRRTGSFISSTLNLPPPQNASEAKGQISLITGHVRLGYVTLEEGDKLIAHLRSFIDAEAVTDLAPRIAAIEAREAARGNQPTTQIGIVVEGGLPTLPGCEGLITRDDVPVIEAVPDDRANLGESPTSSREVTSGEPPGG
jgi:hypothetical protein